MNEPKFEKTENNDEKYLRMNFKTKQTKMASPSLRGEETKALFVAWVVLSVRTKFSIRI